MIVRAFHSKNQSIYHTSDCCGAANEIPRYDRVLGKEGCTRQCKNCRKYNSKGR